MCVASRTIGWSDAQGEVPSDESGHVSAMGALRMCNPSIDPVLRKEGPSNQSMVSARLEIGSKSALAEINLAWIDPMLP